ncbi:MAG: GLUG motif-containing protein [Kiritimatiellia bacterium]
MKRGLVGLLGAVFGLGFTFQSVAVDVSTLEGLQNMRNDDSAYVLINNIDASATTNWNELTDVGAWSAASNYVRVANASHARVTNAGKAYYALKSSGPAQGGAQEPGVSAQYTDYWRETTLTAGHRLGFDPITSASGSAFNNSFDGQGFVISHLYINRPEQEKVGLFTELAASAKAIIKNLVLERVDITGDGRVGAVAGYGSIGSRVINCGSSGSVKLTGLLASTIPAVGGLQGTTYKGYISNCWSSATVTALASKPAGGLVGLMHAGASDGEFAGYVDNSYALGNVTGTSGRLGGLVGYALMGATIRNSYARGTVTADGTDRRRGGLVGHCFGARLINCYSTGKVLPAGGTRGGGLVGETNTVAWFEDTDNFWDTEASEWSASTMGVGRATAQMKDIATFVAWDIATAKNDPNDGYPYLNGGLSPIWRLFAAPGGTILMLH